MSNLTDKLALKHPFTFKGQRIEELEVRKPKPKHLEAMDEHKGDMARNNALFASLCGVPIDVIRELDFEDFEALGERVGQLMGKCLKTGAG